MSHYSPLISNQAIFIGNFWKVLVASPEAFETVFRAEGKLPSRGYFEDNIMWLYKKLETPPPMFFSWVIAFYVEARAYFMLLTKAIKKSGNEPGPMQPSKWSLVGWTTLLSHSVQWLSSCLITGKLSRMSQEMCLTSGPTFISGLSKVAMCAERHVS